MPQYSIETSIYEDLGRCSLKLRAVREDRPVAENERVIDIDDIEMLFGALTSRLSEYRTLRAFRYSLSFVFNTSDVNIAIETVISANQSVGNLKSDIQNHFFSQCYLGLLDPQVTAPYLRNLSRLTEQYGELLSAFEYATDNTIGRLFRNFVDINPGDDLIREYQFLGRTRKLVIPKLGDYKRIDVPEDLAYNSISCRVGKFYQTVKKMNELMAQIDWHCLKIAHKMRDHQETTIPNGPYWVI